MPENAVPPPGVPLPDVPTGGLSPAAPLPYLHPLDELDQLAAGRPAQRNAWALWLFVLPLIAAILPPLYNFVNPRLIGMPFFVWYQFLVVIFGAVVTGVIYRLRGTESELER